MKMKKKQTQIEGQMSIYSYDDSDFDCKQTNSKTSHYVFNEYNDLSQSIKYAILSKKRLITITSGTGRGKSYSLNISFVDILDNPSLFLVDRIIYVTDRKANVEHEYQGIVELIKSKNGNKNDALRLFSNYDSIHNNVDKLSSLFNPDFNFHFTDDFTRFDLQTLIKLAKKEKSLETKEFEDLERRFRNRVKKTLENDNDYKNAMGPKRKLDYILGHEHYRIFADIYPNMRIFNSKVIYATIDKIYHMFDTIIGGTFDIFNDRQFINNSLFVFDEGDALCHRMLEIEADIQSKSGLELNQYCSMIVNSLPNRNVFLKKFGVSEHLKINSMYDDLENQRDMLLEKFGFPNDSLITKINSMLSWMFITNDEDILSDTEEMYVVIDKENLQSEIVKNEFENSIPLKDYVFQLEHFLNSTFSMLRAIANIEYQRDNNRFKYRLIDSIRTVLSEFGIHGSDSNKELICRLLSHSSKRSLENSISKSYYDTPSALIRVSDNIDNYMKVKLNRHSLGRTPEWVLKNIIESGGIVILSSATANNRSVLRNFDLNWEPLASAIYINDNDELKRLEKEYCHKLDLYKDKINLYTEYTNFEDFEKNESVLVNKFGSEFLCLLNELKKYSPKQHANDDGSFSYKRHLERFVVILDINEKAMPGALMISNEIWGPNDKNGKKYTQIINNILEHFELKYTNCRFHFVNAENLKDELTLFKTEIKQGLVPIFITPYAASEKGLNIVGFVKELNEIIKLNNIRGDKDMGKSDPECDVPYLFLDLPTNIFPSISSEGRHEDRVKQKLIAGYYNTRLLLNQEIDEEEYRKFGLNILKGNNKYPFGGSLYKTDTYIAAIISKVIQAVGRISRCSLQHQECYIKLSGEFAKRMSQVNQSREHYINDNEYDELPFKVRAAVDLLFDKDSALNPQNCSAVGVSIKDANDRTNKSIIKAINAMFSPDDDNYGDSSYYKPMQELKCLSINPDERKKMDKIKQTFYTKLSNNRFDPIDGYAYEYLGEDAFGNPIAGKAKHCGYASYRNVSLSAVHLLDWQIEYLEQEGFSFDISKAFKITPSAFEKFKGNCGEKIGCKYVKEMLGYQIEELPSIMEPETGRFIYEKMDYIYMVKENGIEKYIMVFDFKFYSSGSAYYDDYQKHKLRYEKKLRDIQEYYGGIPVFALSLNTRFNDEFCNDIPYADKNLLCYNDSIWIFRAHNIYNEKGEWGNEVTDKINHFIKHFEMQIEK